MCCKGISVIRAAISLTRAKFRRCIFLCWASSYPDFRTFSLPWFFVTSVCFVHNFVATSHTCAVLKAIFSSDVIVSLCAKNVVLRALLAQRVRRLPQIPGRSKHEMSCSTWQVLVFVSQSALRQTHSFLQGELCTECDLVLHLTVSGTHSLPQGHQVAAYVFFLVFPSLMVFVLSFLLQRVVDGSYCAVL